MQDMLLLPKSAVSVSSIGAERRIHAIDSDFPEQLGKRAPDVVMRQLRNLKGFPYVSHRTWGHFVQLQKPPLPRHGDCFRSIPNIQLR